MEVSYILELINQQKESILAYPTTMERIDKVIEIAEDAPIPPGTPVGFEFMERMNVESFGLIRALKMYKKSGRIVLSSNEICDEEAEHVNAALDYVYELCEKGTVNEEKGDDQ